MICTIVTSKLMGVLCSTVMCADTLLCGYLQSPKYTCVPTAANGSGGGGNSELSAVVVARDEAVVLDGRRQHSVSCAGPASHMERKALAAGSFSGGSGGGGSGGGSRPRSIQLVVQP